MGRPEPISPVRLMPPPNQASATRSRPGQSQAEGRDAPGPPEPREPPKRPHTRPDDLVSSTGCHIGLPPPRSGRRTAEPPSQHLVGLTVDQAAIPWLMRPSRVSTSRAPSLVSSRSSGRLPAKAAVGRRSQVAAFSRLPKVSSAAANNLNTRISRSDCSDVKVPSLRRCARVLRGRTI